MSLTKLTANLNNIGSLPDKPTVQSNELKAKFDLAGNTIKDYINEILTIEIEKMIDNTVKSNKTTVENTLLSTSSINALSANQGKILKELVDTLKSKLDGIDVNANKTIVEDILTSTSKTNALSANQGKQLKILIDTLTTRQKTITSGTSAPSGGNNGDIYIQYF